MAWALGHQRQPELWKKIAEIYKALCLKPVRSTADLQTKNYTCVTGLVDADAMIRRDYLVLIMRCQQTVLWQEHAETTEFSVWHLNGLYLQNYCLNLSGFDMSVRTISAHHCKVWKKGLLSQSWEKGR
jgi:hypothetical protein